MFYPVQPNKIKAYTQIPIENLRLRFGNGDNVESIFYNYDSERVSVSVWSVVYVCLRVCLII